MNKLDHPFILNLKGVSQDKRIVYMFVEYFSEGDLMGVLSRWTKFDVVHARFYAAHIVSVFEYMHHKNYVYRDLKPENVLV